MITFHDHGYGRFDADHRIGPAHLDRFDVLLVHRGRATIRFMGKVDESLSRGQGVLIYPDTSFAGRARTPVCQASVQHFRIETSDSAGLLTPLALLVGRRRGYSRFTVADMRTVERDVRRAMALAAERQSALVHDLRVAHLAILLGQVLGGKAGLHQEQAEHPAVRAAIDLMRKRPDQTVSVPALAAAAGISVSHLRALFRRELGTSPARQHQTLRMAEAARLLRQTHQPIKQIARQVGFDELANFYRTFRRHHRLTPAAYRLRYTVSG